MFQKPDPFSEYSTTGFYDGMTPEEKAEFERLNNATIAAAEKYSRQRKGVPNAPFKNDWHELVMKRMLRHAAENGYDRMAWVTGDQTAARYDLSKQIEEVSYDPEEQTLYAKDHSGKEVIHETGVEPEQIVNYIGKEPAKKLMEEVRNYGSVGDTSEWNVERNTEPNSEGLYEFSVRDPNGEVWHDRSGKPETFASEQEARRHIQSMADQDKAAQGFPKQTHSCPWGVL